jgi:hypothetical protein
MHKFLIQIFEIDFEIFVCLCTRSKIANNGFGLGEGGDLHHKCLCGALNRQFLIGAVLNETFGSYLSKKQLPYQN